VQVSRVDLDGRKIDFRLVRSELDAPVRGGRGKTARAEDLAFEPSMPKLKASVKNAQAKGGKRSAKPKPAALRKGAPSAKASAKKRRR